MDKKLKNTDWKSDFKAPAGGLAYYDNSRANWHNHQEYHKQNLPLPNPYTGSTEPVDKWRPGLNSYNKNTNQIANNLKSNESPLNKNDLWSNKQKMQNPYVDINSSQGASGSGSSSWNYNSASASNSYASINNPQGASANPNSSYGPCENY